MCRGELRGKGLRRWLRLRGRRLDLRRLCRRCMRFARRVVAGAFNLHRRAGLGTGFGLSRGGSRCGGRLRLILRRCICRRLGAHAHRFRRRRGTCRIDGVGRGRIGHGAGRGWIGRYRWRGRGCRRRCRNAGRPPAIDADGVRAGACRARHGDQHGLQGRSAEQNAAGGKHEKRQFRSVSVGHGRPGWCCRLCQLNPLRRIRLT